jgi:hypothetical protein
MTASIPAEVSAEIRAGIARAKHDLRDEEFREFMESSDDPRRETRFQASCRCVKYLARLSDDGETTYREWTWTTHGCLGGNV